jgi:multiple antibiotic resistance protein
MFEQSVNFNHLFQVFTSLLIIIDPVAVVPMFLLLTKGDTPEHKKHIAIRATFIASGVLFIFAILGDRLLDTLNIGEPAFRIAGGLLLLFAAIDMVIVKDTGIRSTTQDETKEAGKKADISVFPLAIPLIAGPGAMTAIVMHMRSPESAGMINQGFIMALLLLVLIINYFCLRHADRLAKLLGVTGTNVVTRVFGIILAAMAIQFMLNGIKLFIHSFTGA